jgi:hypothetical protein
MQPLGQRLAPFGSRARCRAHLTGLTLLGSLAAAASVATAQTVTAVNDLREGSVTANDAAGFPSFYAHSNLSGPSFLPIDVSLTALSGQVVSKASQRSEWLSLGPGNSTLGFKAALSIGVELLYFQQGFSQAYESASVDLTVAGLAPGETMPFILSGSIDALETSCQVRLIGQDVQIEWSSPASWNQTVELSNGIYSLDADAFGVISGAVPFKGSAEVVVSLEKFDATPPNDMCTFATAAHVGVNAFDTTDADGSLEAVAPCGGETFMLYGDVYFRYVAEGTGVATVDLCQKGANMQLAAFTGTCLEPTWIGCNVESPCGPSASSISFPTVCGETYSIVVGSTGPEGDPVAGTITISQQGTCSDFCEHPDEIYAGENDVSTVGATGGLELPAFCDEGFGTALLNDRYYLFNATVDGLATFSTCGNADFDTRLAVLSDCGTRWVLGCNDDASGCSGFSSQVTVPVACGQAVRVAVGSFDGTTGTATLTVSQQGSCTSFCLADLDDDGMVGPADLGILLGQWGVAGSADLSGNGLVEPADLGLLLGEWGPCK